MDIVKKQHNESAMEELKSQLIPEAYQMALNEHNVMPVSYPEVTDVSMGITGDLKFTAKVDVQPEIKLKKYKGLKASCEKIKVTDEEVKEALERMRGVYAEFSDLDKPLEKGNFAICDVETFMDGEVIAKKRENMWIEADKEASLLGMGEELIGFKKNDKKEIEATLPETYPDKKYAGKKALLLLHV